MYIEALSIYIELRYLIIWQGSKIHDIEAKIYYNCNKEMDDQQLMCSLS